MAKNVSLLKKRVIKLLKSGLTQKDAAFLSGRNEDTLGRWKNEDADFADKIERAKIESKKGAVELILQIAREKKDWRPIAWFLERRYPQEFGKAALEDKGPQELKMIIEDYRGEDNKVHYKEYTTKRPY